MAIKIIILLLAVLVLAGSSQAVEPFNYGKYYVEQGYHYGCDPDHLDGRLFESYRNGKELF